MYLVKRLPKLLNGSVKRLVELGKNIIARIRFKGMIIEFYSYKSLRKFTQEFIINKLNSPIVLQPKSSIPKPKIPILGQSNDKLQTEEKVSFIEGNPWLKVLAKKK